MLTKPLYIYPFPVTDEDRTLLIEAKNALGLDFLVMPTQATALCGRVLALRETPPFLCDHALVREVTNMEALEAAMEWAVTKKVDTRSTTVAQMIERATGLQGVRELPREELLGENLGKSLKLNDMRTVPMFRQDASELDLND